MKRTLALLFGLILSLGTVSALGLVQDGWTPWQFGQNEVYEFRIQNHQARGKNSEELTVVLDIAPADAGQSLISYTTKSLVPTEKLGAETAFGSVAWAAAPSFLILNPMVAGFMNQVELEVGATMSLFGAGRIDVEKKETVAGVEGFLCRMYGAEQQGSPLQFEWVVNPDMALPLRSVQLQNGEPTFEMTLLRYEKR